MQSWLHETFQLSQSVEVEPYLGKHLPKEENKCQEDRRDRGLGLIRSGAHVLCSYCVPSTAPHALMKTNILPLENFCILGGAICNYNLIPVLRTVVGLF